MKTRLEILLTFDQRSILISIGDNDLSIPNEMLRSQQGGLDMVQAALLAIDVDIKDHACYVVHDIGCANITNDGPGIPSITDYRSAYSFSTYQELWEIHRMLNAHVHTVESMTIVFERLYPNIFLVKRLGGPKLHWAQTLNAVKDFCTHIPANMQLGYIVEDDFREIANDDDWVVAKLTI